MNTDSANRRTHCVFRHGSQWLALPATSVREALPSPPLVRVPATPARFAGLCHLRSEFIPVLNLNDEGQNGSDLQDRLMLVVDDSDGCWAVLVDEVSSLANLEFSDAPESDTAATTAVIGWAAHNSNVVQILDPVRFRELVEQELESVKP
ncbi:MAG: chemotaxis protein CheW [Planctomycetaceae bacterium]